MAAPRRQPSAINPNGPGSDPPRRCRRRRIHRATVMAATSSKVSLPEDAEAAGGLTALLEISATPSTLRQGTPAGGPRPGGAGHPIGLSSSPLSRYVAGHSVYTGEGPAPPTDPTVPFALVVAGNSIVDHFIAAPLGPLGPRGPLSEVCVRGLKVNHLLIQTPLKRCTPSIQSEASCRCVFSVSESETSAGLSTLFQMEYKRLVVVVVQSYRCSFMAFPMSGDTCYFQYDP